MIHSLLDRGRLPLVAMDFTLTKVVAGLATLVAGGAGLGLLAASNTPAGAGEEQSLRTLASFSSIFVLFSVSMTIYFVSVRICRDHDERWPLVLVSRGVSRWGLVASTVLVGAAIGLVVYVVLISVCAATLGVNAPLLRLAFDAGALVVAYSAFASLVALVVLDSARVFFVAALLIATPFLTVLVGNLQFGGLPSWTSDLLTLHLPRRGTGIARQLVYLTIVLTIVRWVAGRRFLRYE